MRLDRVCLTYRREEVGTGAVNYPLIILAGGVINFRRNATVAKGPRHFFPWAYKENSGVFPRETREFAR